MSAALSGRVSTLETQVTNIMQQLLLKIDLATHTSLQGVINQSLDTVTTNVNAHETRIDNLEGLYSSLVYNFNVHVGNFTGHTGQTGIHFTQQ